jgi:hypothetical protein
MIEPGDDYRSGRQMVEAFADHGSARQMIEPGDDYRAGRQMIEA